MATASQKVLIREMESTELQEMVDEIYSRHDGDLHQLSAEEHETLRQCTANYFALTGEALSFSFHAQYQIL